VYFDVDLEEALGGDNETTALEPLEPVFFFFIFPPCTALVLV
jgi:hypothetical protein